MASQLTAVVRARGGATPPRPSAAAEAVAAAPIETAVVQEDHDEAGVEEVPMPVGDFSSVFFFPGRGGDSLGLIVGCTDTSGSVFAAGNAVLGSASTVAAAADDAAAVLEEDKVRAMSESPGLEPLVGFVIGGEDLTASVANANVDEGEGSPKDGKKKRRRSLRLVQSQQVRCVARLVDGGSIGYVVVT